MMRLIGLVFSFIVVLIQFSCQDEMENKKITKNDLDKLILSKNNRFKIINSNPDLHNSLVFKTREDFEKFLSVLERQEEDDPTVGGDFMVDPNCDSCGGGINDQSNNFVKFSYLVGMGTYINVGFNVSNCKGSNLTSWLSGFALGASYNHVGGTLNNQPGTIAYSVYGVLNYNVFVEGVGTIFSEDKVFRGQYRCN